MGEAQQLAAIDEIHGLLANREIEYWLFGGWAVDFHAGSVTRPHEDIDVAVWAKDYQRIVDLLTYVGWSPAAETDVEGLTAFERDGVRLEAAVLVRDEDGSVYTPLPDGGAGWPQGAFGNDLGAVAGVTARVVGVDALVADKTATHADPVAAAKDRADLVTLSRLR